MTDYELNDRYLSACFNLGIDPYPGFDYKKHLRRSLYFASHVIEDKQEAKTFFADCVDDLLDKFLKNYKGRFMENKITQELASKFVNDIFENNYTLANGYIHFDNGKRVKYKKLVNEDIYFCFERYVLIISAKMNGKSDRKIIVDYKSFDEMYSGSDRSLSVFENFVHKGPPERMMVDDLKKLWVDKVKNPFGETTSKTFKNIFVIERLEGEKVYFKSISSQYPYGFCDDFTEFKNRFREITQQDLDFIRNFKNVRNFGE